MKNILSEHYYSAYTKFHAFEISVWKTTRKALWNNEGLAEEGMTGSILSNICIKFIFQF